MMNLFGPEGATQYSQSVSLFTLSVTFLQCRAPPFARAFGVPWHPADSRPEPNARVSKRACFGVARRARSSGSGGSNPAEPFVAQLLVAAHFVGQEVDL